MGRIERELKALQKNPISNPPQNIPDNVTLSDEIDRDNESQINHALKLLEEAEKYNNSEEGRMRIICNQLNTERNYPITIKKLECDNDVLIKDSAEYFVSKPKKIEVICNNGGFGLRVCEDCRMGAFIIEYVGKLVTKQDVDKMDDERKSYVMEVKKNSYIDASRLGGLGRFVNHSCEPNCVIKPWVDKGVMRLGIFAIRELIEYEEITFDHKWESRESGKSTKCERGDQNCRGIIEYDGVRTNQYTNHDAITDEMTSKRKESVITTKKRKRNGLLGISTVPTPCTHSPTNRSREHPSPVLYQRYLREGLSEEQSTFLDNYLSANKEDLSSETKNYSVNDAVQYVRSFEHTFLCNSRQKRQSISFTFDDFLKPENEDVSSFLTSYNSTKTYYCHIPIERRIGNEQTTHMIGVTVAVMRYEIIVYDPKWASNSCHGSSEKNRTDYVEDYMEDDSIAEDIRKVVKTIYEKVKEHIHLFRWKVVTITEWLQKDINVDFGLYVLFFFECIARKAALTLGAHDDKSGEYLVYRKRWIAFSSCVRRSRIP